MPCNRRTPRGSDCCTCYNCSRARDILVARHGYAGIEISGGPNIPLLPTLESLQPLWANWSIPYAAKDFSGALSGSITSAACNATARDFLCGTHPFLMSSVFDYISHGGTNFNSRMLRAYGYVSDTDCFYSGSLYLGKPFEIGGGVNFLCTDNRPNYLLRIEATVIFVEIVNGSTNTLYYPPATSSEWVLNAGVYTKNGSTAAEGATMNWVDGPDTPTGTATRLTSAAWASYPNTSVSLWTPTDVIDVSGYLVGTVDLV